MNNLKQISAGADNARVLNVLLVCALRDEYAQVLNVTDGLNPEGWHQSSEVAGHIFSEGIFLANSNFGLRIRATWSSQMGRERVQALASKFLSDFPADCLAMSGICAGLRGSVSLGDVVFADMFWSYDAGKRTDSGESRFVPDGRRYPIRPEWNQRLQSFDPPTDGPWFAGRPHRPLEYQEDWSVLKLMDGPLPLGTPEFEDACPDWLAVLKRLVDKTLIENNEERGFCLSEIGLKYGRELNFKYPQGLPEPRPFAVHVAPMATGEAVVQDPEIFDVITQSARKTLAMDMEASAIAALAEINHLPIVVAKGVSDFGDPVKDDRYRIFASRASAECLILFLRTCGDLLTQDRNRRISAQSSPSVISFSSGAKEASDVDSGRVNCQEDLGVHWR